MTIREVSMRFLLYVVLLLVGGVIGFFIGGATTVASGLTGTQLGACTAATVASRMGLITPADADGLLGAVSGYLRSEFPRLTKELGLEGQPPLSSDRCAEVLKQIEAIRQRMQ
jgi:hypothetical protein